jgi:putative ABC transport system permease protein
MNLAARDLRRRLGRFIGTAAGLGLLFSVVVAMQGIYAGMVDEATILTRAMGADLWVVQHGTRGPFAEASRVDPSLEGRIASVPGVRRARSYTYLVIQRDLGSREVRLALVGLAWPDDRGATLPLIAGRELAQAHGEMVVDASLGLSIGETLQLAGEPYRVVGLTRNALTSAGDAVAFMSAADTQLVANELPDEALRIERQRSLDRLRQTDLGRAQPGLEDLLLDARFRPPALPSHAVNAVLVNVTAPAQLDQVRRVLDGWGDVRVFTSEEQVELILQGVVQRAKMQIGLFTLILTLTAAAIVMMVIYTMMLEKTHDIAVLKLLGAPAQRLVFLVLQQAWLLGAVGYGMAFVLGQLVYPSFPRRVFLTPQILWGAPVVVFVLTTIASMLGVAHAMRVDAGRVLEG